MRLHALRALGMKSRTAVAVRWEAQRKGKKKKINPLLKMIYKIYERFM